MERKKKVEQRAEMMKIIGAQNESIEIDANQEMEIYSHLSMNNTSFYNNFIFVFIGH